MQRLRRAPADDYGQTRHELQADHRRAQQPKVPYPVMRPPAVPELCCRPGGVSSADAVGVKRGGRGCGGCRGVCAVWRRGATAVWQVCAAHAPAWWARARHGDCSTDTIWCVHVCAGSRSDPTASAAKPTTAPTRARNQTRESFLIWSLLALASIHAPVVPSLVIGCKLSFGFWEGGKVQGRGDGGEGGG